MSSYKGVDLFGSGPHRFAQLKQGQLMLREFDPPSPATYPAGLVELDVVVSGRLAASSDAALWALRDAAAAMLQEFPTPGLLVGSDGRQWADMIFITLAEGDRTDRGRVRSLAYTATFRRLRPLVRTPAVGTVRGWWCCEGVEAHTLC